jgi:predicted Rdx family selenoprotein
MTPSSCVSLKEGQAPLGDIKFPLQCLLQCQWKLRDNLLSNVLYQPQVSNLEAGDAFCLIKQADGTFMLIVLQITIAERHPVKVNGLKVIVNAYSEQMKANITRKIILFVIPVDGELRTCQPLHTQNNRFVEDAKLPPEAKNFEQWAYHRVVSGM